MQNLRLVLRLNGTSCVVFGLLFVLVPSSVAAFLAEQAPAPTVAIAVLGAGLMLNGLALFLTANAQLPDRASVRLFALGDFLWVAATLVLIAAGLWIDCTAGVAAALAVAAFVGTLGWLQWRAAAGPDPAVADVDSP